MSESCELPAGTLLGAYRVVRCIGTGGMGAVYEAEHCELRKRVALKTPFTNAGLSAEGRARFVEEGKTASRIRHPHVVDITDVGEAGDVVYLVMEYLEGEPLSSRILREGPLPTELIADILVPVSAAMNDAHRMGIIHRDLKPDNIFITRSVQGGVHPKILDFGISKVLGDERFPKLTLTNAILGTPHYASPEQLQGSHAITAHSDQYSLGVIIYEAATGNNPFRDFRSLMSLMRAIEQGDYRLPTELNPEVDARLETIALRAMARMPHARYASMVALGADLLPLASVDTQTAWSRYFAGDDPVSRTPASAQNPGQRAPRSTRDSAAPSSKRRGGSLASPKWPRSRIEAVVLAGVVAVGLAAIVGVGATSCENVEAKRMALEPSEPKPPAATAPAVAAPVAPALVAPAPALAARDMASPEVSAAGSARSTAAVADEPDPRAMSAPRTSRLLRPAKPPTGTANRRPAARSSPERDRAAASASEPDGAASERARAALEGASRGPTVAPSYESLRTDNVDPWDVGSPSPLPPVRARIE